MAVNVRLAANILDGLTEITNFAPAKTLLRLNDAGGVTVQVPRDLEEDFSKRRFSTTILPSSSLTSETLPETFMRLEALARVRISVEEVEAFWDRLMMELMTIAAIIKPKLPKI